MGYVCLILLMLGKVHCTYAAPGICQKRIEGDNFASDVSKITVGTLSLSNGDIVEILELQDVCSILHTYM
jgi:hypothetical protein